MQSSTEEDYLKAIYKLGGQSKDGVSTNAIAERLNTKASSVTDMVRKLSEKGLVSYIKYQGTTITKEGEQIALKIIRKHRLWEVFLVDKLKFGWEEIHEIAEQLEHIRSPLLINKLDEFLGFPKTDPHGDPIPDANGKFQTIDEISLNKLVKGEKAILIGVLDHSREFLQYLDAIKLNLGATIEIVEYFKFDKSIKVTINGKQEQTFSELVASNLNVSKKK